MKVDIDINLSAQVNVQRYFEIKKKSQQKEHRTKEAADQAIKVAENNAMKDLEKHRNQAKKVDRVRKVFWFEKFDWFISSENYLIISGKSA
jgi:predicted ribosome quality control (RQC) complex YloA/Tae2 family protein